MIAEEILRKHIQTGLGVELTDAQWNREQKHIDVYLKAMKEYASTHESTIASLREENERLKASKWISVEERLPTKKDFYLCNHNKGMSYVYYFTGKQFEDFDYLIVYPLFWMPLPENP